MLSFKEKELKIHTPKEIDAIISELWEPNEHGEMPNVFVILDGARDKRIEPMINNSKLPHECLYAGRISYVLKRAAPHIVSLKRDSEFVRKLLKDGWGNSWGVFITAFEDVTMAAIRNNCRRISKVRAPNGKTLVFRYYDPRVLRVLLPTCGAEQLRKLFGPAYSIKLEGEHGLELLEFTEKQLLRYRTV